MRGKETRRRKIGKIGPKYLLLIGIAIAFCFSFSAVHSPSRRVAAYYDKQTDSLLRQLRQFQTDLRNTHTTNTLRERFLECRNAYKRIEMFVDVFDQRRARMLNGPDLLRIDEENPGDSMVPHGFQVMEGLLYGETIDEEKLQRELSFTISLAEQLRNDPDRIYYFKDEKIWHTMRLGVYRVISLGITGFDVPFSNHALPESRQVLRTVASVTAIYKSQFPDSVYKIGKPLLAKADAYLASNNHFNSFDRATFIRDHLNAISDWLTGCSRHAGYIRYDQREPLNPAAGNLFANDIMNISFFSPNGNYAITPQRVALGKKLFYDAILSGNNSRSCVSCHAPEKAFTDGLPRAQDVTGTKTLLRNTLTLWNTALQTAQFYDSRTKKLENQLSAVVHNRDEMNGSLRESIPRLKDNKQYDSLFRRAYAGAGESITEYNIANAISSYVRTLISFNSRFDRFIRDQADSFSQAEKNGFNLFMGKAKCGTCHYAPLFNGLTPPLYEDTESEILGVPSTKTKPATLDGDEGKYRFTKISIHKYAFKTSGVRNIALTAPYMHNGVFNTLEEVMDFYNNGGGRGRGIRLETQTLPTDQLHLSKKEVKDIIAFLHTLNDTCGRSL
jgi:cytochrome c peroxidase